MHRSAPVRSLFMAASLAVCGALCLASGAAHATATSTTIPPATTPTPYGDNVVQITVSTTVPCPAPPGSLPQGTVTVRVDGVAWLAARAVFFASCPSTGPGSTSPAPARAFVTLRERPLPIGTHLVAAEYTGDGSYDPSRSEPVTLVVTAHFSAVPFEGSGRVNVGIDGRVNDSDRWNCKLSSASLSQRTSVPTPPPASVEFPFGLFTFAIDSCRFEGPGGSAPPLRQRMLLQLPQKPAAGATLWTYAPRAGGGLPEWRQVAADIDGPNAMVVLADGGTVDQTGAGDGVISGILGVAIPKVNRVRFEVEGLWWAGPQENGWGLSISRTVDRLFTVFFVYDENGRSQWIVMPGGAWDADYLSYTGALYIPKGSWFGQYDASHLDVGSPVGSATLTFSSADAAMLTYTVRGASGSKTLQRQIFGAGAELTDKFGGLWWGGELQNGWGLGIHQQKSTLFNVWFTYDTQGAPVWFVMPGGAWVTPRLYAGALYRTRGSPWAGRTYDPRVLVVERAGTMSVAFDSESNGYLTYSLDGVEATRSITRQPF